MQTEAGSQGFEQISVGISFQAAFEQYTAKLGGFL
jgi:hypothetical protein